MPVTSVSLSAMINQWSATGSVDEQKKSFRKKVRSLKQPYTTDELQRLSILLWNKIEESSFFKEASVILLYWSLPDEVSTHDFIKKWSAAKTIILPSISGSDLILKQYKGEENLIAAKDYEFPNRRARLILFLKTSISLLSPESLLTGKKIVWEEGKDIMTGYWIDTLVLKWVSASIFSFLIRSPLNYTTVKWILSFPIKSVWSV